VQQLPDEEPQAAETAQAQAAASAGVTIQNFAFSPATVTVNVGDTVTWTNQDDVQHSATASDGSFDTGLLSQGSSGSATFDTAGTFAYICTPHPNMKGTVVVQGAQTGGDSTGGSGGSGSSDSGATAGTTGGSASTTAGGSTLAATGMDALALGLLGVFMLALGLGIRRRSERERPLPAGRPGW
jgi:plastocyanin